MTNHHPTEVVAATAADENYALPLAVTVRSAIDSLGPDTHLRLYVLNGGMTRETCERLERSWRDPRLHIEWLAPNVEAIEHLPVSHHVSKSCYLRLMLPELVSPDCRKIIYFDSDMLLRRDLADLYAEPVGDELQLAVQEMVAPWIDAELAADDYPRCERYLAAARPVPNYRELGLRPEAMYFNSGLLVFDPARWREEQIGRRVLDCLQENQEHVLWWDQYALNVVLADKWRALDPRWNQTAGIFNYPGWRESPVDQEMFHALRDDPWIVHYCSPSKPWHYFCDHPFRNEFFATLDRTDWRGWRPPLPADTTRLGWRHWRIKFKKTARSIVSRARERLTRAA